MIAVFADINSRVADELVAAFEVANPLMSSGELKDMIGVAGLIALCNAIMGVSGADVGRVHSFEDGDASPCRENCCLRFGGCFSCMLTGLLISASWNRSVDGGSSLAWECFLECAKGEGENVAISLLEDNESWSSALLAVPRCCSCCFCCCCNSSCR